MCPRMHIRKIAVQVNTLPIRLVHENVGLRTCYSSEVAIKLETREGTHGNRMTPDELHDTKHGQLVASSDFFGEMQISDPEG